MSVLAPSRAAAAFALALVAPSTPLAAQAPPFTRSVELSGVVYGNFQYHVEPGATPSQDAQVRAGLEENQFSLERAYLNVRAAVAPRTSLRVTSDLHRADDGYELRLKYGYVDYRFLERGRTGTGRAEGPAARGVVGVGRRPDRDRQGRAELFQEAHGLTLLHRSVYLRVGALPVNTKVHRSV